MESESKDTHGALGTPWYGFDLDGTLAYYDHWHNYCHIGAPVPKMVERIKAYHNAGKLVKIVTARVAPKATDPKKPCGGTPKECREVIEKWCRKYLGFVPEITHEKDHLMLELYDDRVKQVRSNTGVLVEEELDEVTKENLAQAAELLALKREKAYSKHVVTKKELLDALNEIADEVYLTRYVGNVKEPYFQEDDITEDNGLSFTITFLRCDTETIEKRIMRLVRKAEKKYEVKDRKKSGMFAEVLEEEFTGKKYTMYEWHFDPNYVRNPEDDED